MSEMTYASNGKANLGVTLGAVGTGLAALGGSGIIGNLFGGSANNNMVSRETFDLSMQLSKSERDNAILSAELNTEKKMVEVFNALNDKINNAVANQTAINSAQAVTNCGFTSAIAVAQNNIAQLLSLTQMKIPNTSVCPGWGTATVSVSTGTGTTT